MKLINRNSVSLLYLLVFTLLLVPFTLSGKFTDQDFIVENLEVNDIPNDDGSGLVISWKPLSKDHRIIEYRVYRGTTPDSLFFIQKIDVNVKTGVSGDVMYFYDKDFNYFLDVQAPGKLKREKGQSRDSRLFQSYPRDLSISGPELENYTILGVISEKDFYYHSQPVEVTEDGETKVYAGLKLRHVNMYKKLIPDKEYYYTVLAVNEARHYFDPAEPVAGIPRDNAPEEPQNLYSVYVPDANKIQFEWDLPLFKDDVSHHSIYLLEKDQVDEFSEFIKQSKEKEANDLERKQNDSVEPYEITSENPAKLIFIRESAYPFTTMNTGTAYIKDGKVIDEENNIETELNVDNFDNYYFIYSYSDYSGYETFSSLKTLDRTMTSAELPKIPAYKVIDRKNDKGDYNQLVWGKPVVNLTNSSYKNDEKTKLAVNYEYFTNTDYKVKNIYFTVFDDRGNELDSVNEFYQDNKIIVEIPENTLSLTFEMKFKCNKELPEDYIFTQKLVFDEVSRSLYPDKLFLHNEEITNFDYKVYKSNNTDSHFYLTKKMAGTQRELDDYVRFENNHFPLVSKFDLDKNLLLVSPSFSIKKDYEKNASIRTNLFLSEVQKSIEDNKKEMQKYQAKKDSLLAVDPDASTEMEDAYIEHYKNQISMTENNTMLKKADSMKSGKARIQFLEKERQKAKRAFAYKIVKSDGKAAFTQSDVYMDSEGNDHFTPVGNWFKVDMFPALLATFIFGALVFIMINKAKRGHDLYLRPIAGISEIDNAIGRATEMGRPILFVPGLSSISDVATLAGLAILGKVAKKAAEYDTRILVPVRDPIVLPIAQETVKEAHYEAGRPDSYDRNSAFFITSAQFAFVAGVNGIMIREKTATNFYMGMFWAEALIMTETGSGTGAIQISGTDAITQIPFFITTCDYTLIGEELYAAAAYLAREPLMLGTLKAQDYVKLLILIFIITGTVLSSFHLTFLINAFPEK